MRMRKAVYDKSAPDGVRTTSSSAAPSRCGHSSVLIQVRAAGINPVDAKHVFADKLPESMAGFAQSVVNGRIPGFDFAGIVLDAPPGSGFTSGDEVFGIQGPMKGTLAERILVSCAQVAYKPVGISFIEAAVLPLVGITALQVFEQHALQAGQHLLVIGASGGVGHIATQLAHRLGARVTAICSACNAELVRSLGADSVVPYDGGTAAWLPMLERIVRTHGPFHLVFDTVSSHEKRDKEAAYESTIRQAASVPLLAAGLKHQYVVIGASTGSWAKAAIKRVIGLNCFEAGRELFWIDPFRCTAQLAALRQAIDEGKLRPQVSATMSFTDGGVQSAFRQLRSRRVVGKLAVDLSRLQDEDPALGS